MANGTTKQKKPIIPVKEREKLQQVAQKEETIKVTFEGPGKYKLSEEQKIKLERYAKRYYETGKIPSLNFEKEGIRTIVFSKWEDEKTVKIKVN